MEEESVVYPHQSASSGRIKDLPNNSHYDIENESQPQEDSTTFYKAMLGLLHVTSILGLNVIAKNERGELGICTKRAFLSAVGFFIISLSFFFSLGILFSSDASFEQRVLILPLLSSNGFCIYTYILWLIKSKRLVAFYQEVEDCGIRLKKNGKVPAAIAFSFLYSFIYTAFVYFMIQMPDHLFRIHFRISQFVMSLPVFFSCFIPNLFDIYIFAFTRVIVVAIKMLEKEVQAVQVWTKEKSWAIAKRWVKFLGLLDIYNEVFSYLLHVRVLLFIVHAIAHLYGLTSMTITKACAFYFWPLLASLLENMLRFLTVCQSGQHLLDTHKCLVKTVREAQVRYFVSDNSRNLESIDGNPLVYVDSGVETSSVRKRCVLKREDEGFGLTLECGFFKEISKEKSKEVTEDISYLKHDAPSEKHLEKDPVEVENITGEEIAVRKVTDITLENNWDIIIGDLADRNKCKTEKTRTNENDSLRAKGIDCRDETVGTVITEYNCNKVEEDFDCTARHMYARDVSKKEISTAADINDVIVDAEQLGHIGSAYRSGRTHNCATSNSMISVFTEEGDCAIGIEDLDNVSRKNGVKIMSEVDVVESTSENQDSLIEDLGNATEVNEVRKMSETQEESFITAVPYNMGKIDVPKGETTSKKGEDGCNSEIIETDTIPIITQITVESCKTKIMNLSAKHVLKEELTVSDTVGNVMIESLSVVAEEKLPHIIEKNLIHIENKSLSTNKACIKDIIIDANIDDCTDNASLESVSSQQDLTMEDISHDFVESKLKKYDVFELDNSAAFTELGSKWQTSETLDTNDIPGSYSNFDELFLIGSPSLEKITINRVAVTGMKCNNSETFSPKHYSVRDVMETENINGVMADSTDSEEISPTLSEYKKINEASAGSIATEASPQESVLKDSFKTDIFNANVTVSEILEVSEKDGVLHTVLTLEEISLNGRSVPEECISLECVADCVSMTREKENIDIDEFAFDKKKGMEKLLEKDSAMTDETSDFSTDIHAPSHYGEFHVKAIIEKSEKNYNGQKNSVSAEVRDNDSAIEGLRCEESDVQETSKNVKSDNLAIGKTNADKDDMAIGQEEICFENDMVKNIISEAIAEVQALGKISRKQKSNSEDSQDVDINLTPNQKREDDNSLSTEVTSSTSMIDEEDRLCFQRFLTHMEEFPFCAKVWGGQPLSGASYITCLGIVITYLLVLLQLQPILSNNRTDRNTSQTSMGIFDCLQT